VVLVVAMRFVFVFLVCLPFLGLGGGVSLDLGLAFGLWPLVFGVFGVFGVLCLVSWVCVLCSWSLVLSLVFTRWSFLDSASCATASHMEQK
jgi:hypothetical protein